MSKQFKPGDKVRCIEGATSGHHPKKGAVYTVSSADDHTQRQTISIKDAAGVEYRGWFARRFELVGVPSATSFKPGDKVRSVTLDNSFFGIRIGGVYTVESLSEDRFIRLVGKGGGWYPSSFELVEADPAAPAGTLKYADLKPGDVIKVTRELTVDSITAGGGLRCVRADGSTVRLGRDVEPFLTIELVSRKPTPLAVGDTVRCALSGRVGTLTGTSEDRKYAWVVFGSGLRPKTRLMSELSAA